MVRQFPLESLLSARRILSPQLVDDYLYFLSDASGLISLYRMNKDGSMPEPLLPSTTALQNPHLMIGESFVVFPDLGKLLVMIDNNGDENYQPCFVPLEGGVPESIFGNKYQKQQLACIHYDRTKNMVYFYRDDRKTPNIECLRANLQDLQELSLGTSVYGNYCAGTSKNHSKVILVDGYTAADNVLYLWTSKSKQRELLFGVPLDKREQNMQYPPSGIFRSNFTEDERGILVRTTLLSDEGSLAYIPFGNSFNLASVTVRGIKHEGSGELEDVRKVDGKYILEYNIDGCTWIYEGKFSNAKKPCFTIQRTIVGKPPVSNGVVMGIEPWVCTSRRKREAGYAFSFTTATRPSQLYLYRSRAPKANQYAASLRRVRFRNS